MIFLYDVWVNWFEGEEDGFNVCHYHEWRKSDQIEILEQVPVLYITESLFDYIENSLHDLPDSLLDMIHKRAYIRKGHTREVLDYAAIVTDGRGILLFDTIGYQIPVRKSRLIPRQEQQVYELCKKAKRHEFEFTEKNDDKNDQIMALSKDEVYGLTRRERQLKKLLMIAMDQLKTTDNVSEVLYWLSEWDSHKLKYVRNEPTVSEVWELLYDEVKLGWGENHEEFCAQLVKGNPFLEKFWEMEQVDNKKLH